MFYEYLNNRYLAGCYHIKTLIILLIMVFVLLLNTMSHVVSGIKLMITTSIFLKDD
jgi:hypothetical protein